MKGWRWKNFEPEEIYSPAGMIAFKQGVWLMDERVLDSLQHARNKIGRPFYVNHNGMRLRGFRSFQENKSITKIVEGKIKQASATYSQHMFGRAVDVTIKGHTVEEMERILKRFFPRVFPYHDMNFCHCDFAYVRKTKDTVH